MRRFILFTFLVTGLSIKGYCQTQSYKMDITEGCNIMKDFIHGGIMEVFGWAPESGKLVANLSDNLIEITYNKGISKYYITKVVQKVELKDEVDYFLEVLQTSSSDNYTKSYNGKLKLVISNTIVESRTVMIFESQTGYFLLRGINTQ